MKRKGVACGASCAGRASDHQRTYWRRERLQVSALGAWGARTQPLPRPQIKEF